MFLGIGSSPKTSGIYRIQANSRWDSGDGVCTSPAEPATGIDTALGSLPSVAMRRGNRRLFLTFRQLLNRIRNGQWI